MFKMFFLPFVFLKTFSRFYCTHTLCSKVIPNSIIDFIFTVVVKCQIRCVNFFFVSYLFAVKFKFVFFFVYFYHFLLSCSRLFYKNKSFRMLSPSLVRCSLKDLCGVANCLHVYIQSYCYNINIVVLLLCFI